LTRRTGAGGSAVNPWPQGLPSEAMDPMRALRAAGTVGVLATVLFLAVAPQAAQAAPEESIASYQTQIAVQADGRMRVTETIEYDFGSANKHGIFRKIPARFRYDDANDRIYPIDNVTVTMDGGSVPLDRSSKDGYQIFKIGDPDRTVTGRHTYAIGYTVRGALNHFNDHEELYWNVVGDEWPVPIGAASATVTGPAAIERIE